MEKLNNRKTASGTVKSTQGTQTATHKQPDTPRNYFIIPINDLLLLRRLIRHFFGFSRATHFFSFFKSHFGANKIEAFTSKASPMALCVCVYEF